jgi:argininosuccinate lyase
VIEDDIYDAISLYTCVNERNITGGPAKKMCIKAIENGEEFIGSICKK